MGMKAPETPQTVAVVGLSHLGCVLAAVWSGMGHIVTAIDFDEATVEGLRRGRPPIFEPGLAEALAHATDAGTLSYSVEPAAVSGSSYVFLSYDTPVGPDDSSDLTLLHRALDAIGPHLRSQTIVIVSSQLPVGTAREFRRLLQSRDPSLEVIYSPENLRLGQALRCYENPGHVIIGCDNPESGRSAASLFAPMEARVVIMDLPSAEMSKHCINTFLATSVTLANQWADICTAMGADFGQVSAAIRLDPRIGANAYLTPGLGFSGGTLGRDLKVLHSLDEEMGLGARLFGEVWDYNASRPDVVRRVLQSALGGLGALKICLLGMTYKAGTSTLRRSVAVQVAEVLTAAGASLSVYDPEAEWGSATLPSSLAICESSREAARDADALVLLTEWEEFRVLDYAEILETMRGSILFDTKDILLSREQELRTMGWNLLQIGRPHVVTGAEVG